MQRPPFSLHAAATLGAVILSTSLAGAQPAPQPPAPQPSVTQPGDDPQFREADALETQALRAWDDNHPAEALPILERAVRLPHRPRTTAQLGLLEARLGRWVRAEAHVLEALGAPDAWVTENRARIESALERIRSRVASLEIECNVAGATVWIADEQIGTLPHTAPLRVPVGTTPVEVRAEGYTPVMLRVTVDAGLTAHERATLVPVPRAAPTPAPAPAPAQPSGMPAARIVAWTGVGLGALLAIGGGVALGIRESAANETLEAGCAPSFSMTPQQRCPDAFARIDATTVASAVLFGSAAAAVGVAAVLFATSGSSSERRPAAFRCGGGPGDIGLACAGSF